MGADQAAPSLELELESNRDAPAVARAAVRELAAQIALDDHQLATLVLLTSELVTNSVLHADAGPEAVIRLCAHASGDRLRVEVTDQGGGFTPRPSDPNRIDGGFGLHIVNLQASDWGVARDGATTVWFEVARP